MNSSGHKIKIAIVHDWLTVSAGAEKVLAEILQLYPDADIFTLVDHLPATQRDFLKNSSVVTSFIQKLPFSRKKYRSYLPLMPLAVEQFDLSAYQLIISSSYAVAKGVIAGPDQLHVCYCHSPIRYAWDLKEQYLRESGLVRGPKSWFARLILHYIRIWDVSTSNGVDIFIANSSFVARRIFKFYRRNATIVFPPVNIDEFDFSPSKMKEDFYLAASRMVPYKKIPLIIEAFSKMPDKKLVVIGDGPEFQKCRQIASSNISILGYQNFEVLKDHMQRARAFVFAAEEDFGIIPLEAQACGTPVIAFGKGGVLETVIGEGLAPHRTGAFFYEQNVDSIVAAVRKFEAGPIPNPNVCRANAEKFSPKRFREEFIKVIEGTGFF